MVIRNRLFELYAMCQRAFGATLGHFFQEKNDAWGRGCGASSNRTDSIPLICYFGLVSVAQIDPILYRSVDNAGKRIFHKGVRGAFGAARRGA